MGMACVDAMGLGQGKPVNFGVTPRYYNKPLAI